MSQRPPTGYVKRRRQRADHGEGGVRQRSLRQVAGPLAVGLLTLITSCLEELCLCLSLCRCQSLCMSLCLSLSLRLSLSLCLGLGLRQSLCLWRTKSLCLSRRLRLNPSLGLCLGLSVARACA